MTKTNRSQFWQQTIERTQDRLQETLGWYPYPALLSCGLVMILIGHLIPELNPRLGSRADVIDLPAARVSDGAMWIGIYSDGKELIATTSDRSRFHWPLVASNADLKAFKAHLEQHQRKVALAAGLANQTTVDKTSVLLSVDQHLKYVHIRPILNAIAEVGISKYGFETKLIKSSPPPTHGS